MPITIEEFNRSTQPTLEQRVLALFEENPLLAYSVAEIHNAIYHCPLISSHIIMALAAQQTSSPLELQLGKLANANLIEWKEYDGQIYYRLKDNSGSTDRKV